MKYTTPDYELEVVETEDILERSLIGSGKGYNVFHDPEADEGKGSIEVEVPNVSILI